jgi:hypothetical protein
MIKKIVIVMYALWPCLALNAMQIKYPLLHLRLSLWKENFPVKTVQDFQDMQEIFNPAHNHVSRLSLCDIYRKYDIKEWFTDDARLHVCHIAHEEIITYINNNCDVFFEKIKELKENILHNKANLPGTLTLEEEAYALLLIDKAQTNHKNIKDKEFYRRSSIDFNTELSRQSSLANLNALRRAS